MLIVKEFWSDPEVEEQKGQADVLIRESRMFIEDGRHYCHVAIYDESLLKRIMAITGWRHLENPDITRKYGVAVLCAHNTTLQEVLGKLRDVEEVRFSPK